MYNRKPCAFFMAERLYITINVQCTYTILTAAQCTHILYACCILYAIPRIICKVPAKNDNHDGVRDPNRSDRIHLCVVEPCSMCCSNALAYYNMFSPHSQHMRSAHPPKRNRDDVSGLEILRVCRSAHGTQTHTHSAKQASEKEKYIR